MDSSTHNVPAPEKTRWADEFSTWPMTTEGVEATAKIRTAFTDLLTIITAHTPKENARYLALTKTKLEEACLFAVKGVAKQTQ